MKTSFCDEDTSGMNMSGIELNVHDIIATLQQLGIPNVTKKSDVIDKLINDGKELDFSASYPATSYPPGGKGMSQDELASIPLLQESLKELINYEKYVSSGFSKTDKNFTVH